MTPEEFAEKMADFSLRLESLFAEGRELESKIKKVLGELHYD